MEQGPSQTLKPLWRGELLLPPRTVATPFNKSFWRKIIGVAQISLLDEDRNAISVDDTIKMIELVLENGGEKTVGNDRSRAASDIKKVDSDATCSGYESNLAR